MLTHTNIASLPASRELDSLVAEQVIGIQNPCMLSAYDRPNPTLKCMCGRDMDHAELPFYSTSIAAAWEVFVRLQEILQPDSYAAIFPWKDGWRVAIGGGYTTAFEIDQQDPMICADTAPLAICRAALKAAGVSDAQ